MAVISKFVRNRVPALQHEMKSHPTTKLKYLFKSNVEAAFESGELPKRYHGWKAIFHAFIDMMGPDGALYPSHAKIAEKSGACVRTVWSALNALERIGLIRVTARYTYDAEKGKKVRTSNEYEVMLTGAQKAAAMIACTVRKAHESSKRQMKQQAKAAKSFIHDLTATITHKPPLNINRGLKAEDRMPKMSHWDTIEWLRRGSQPT